MTMTLARFQDRETDRLKIAAPTLNCLREDLEIEVQGLLASHWERLNQPPSEVPTVYSRVKSESSVRDRIAERYATLEEFPDLVGIRVVVLHSGHVNMAMVALEQMTRPNQSVTTTYHSKRGRATGYGAATYRAMPLSKVCKVYASQEIKGMQWELQIHTSFQEAWARLSHSAFYKSKDGVPQKSSDRLSRLAAVGDLLDEQMSTMAKSIREERDIIVKAVANESTRPGVPLDECSLVEVVNVSSYKLENIVSIGESALMKSSEWKDTVRPGDETEICLQVFRGTGATTLGAFIDYMDTCNSASDACAERLKTAFKLEPQEDRANTPINRALLVLSYLRLLDHPYQIPGSVAYLRPSLHQSLQHYADSKRNGEQQ